MTLRHIILDFLYEHPEGCSHTAIYHHWWKIEPGGLFKTDGYTRSDCLIKLIRQMLACGELELLGYAWYQLSTSKWLQMTRDREVVHA